MSLWEELSGAPTAWSSLPSRSAAARCWTGLEACPGRDMLFCKTGQCHTVRAMNEAT